LYSLWDCGILGFSHSEMEKGLDCLADIVPGRETWRIKVRVLRMWEVPSFLKPDETNSLEMVLIDQKVFCLY
jgi:hypothetical protein